MRDTINPRALRALLQKAYDCADNAPVGTYLDVKAVVGLVNDTMSNLADAMASLGLKFDGSDAAEELAGVIYGFIKASNPEAYSLDAGEGFGAAMNTDAKGRVIAQAARDRDALGARHDR